MCKCLLVLAVVNIWINIRSRIWGLQKARKTPSGASSSLEREIVLCVGCEQSLWWKKHFPRSGADVYSLWHFNLWVIDSIACRAVIFLFIAFSSSLSNLDSSSSQLQPVSSNHELFLDSPHSGARFFPRLRQGSLKPQQDTLPSLGKVERAYCVLCTFKLPKTWQCWHHNDHHLGCSRGVGFGVGEPRSGFVTTRSLKSRASYLTPLRLSFLISKMKVTIITPAWEGCWEDWIKSFV